MEQEYDFSKAERGKFYKADLKVNLPIYLEAEVLGFLQERAGQKGVELNQLVNDLLKKDIALIESVL